MVLLKVFCVLVEIYLVQCTIFECPDGVQVNGNSIICPGEVGIFRCTTLNSVQLNWDVGGETLAFRNSRNTCSDDDRVKQNGPTTAYLVERNLDSDGMVGNSTSVLFYTPDPNTRGFVNISCDGGRVDTFCSRNVRVIGNGTIKAPINITGNSIITWDHENEEIVDHYRIVLDSEEIEDQINIQVNTSRVVFPNLSSCSSGTLRAVSVCKQESDAVSICEDSPVTECPTEEAREEGARGGLLAWTGVSVVLIVVLVVACVAMFFWALYLRQVIKHHVQEHHLQQQRRSKSPTPPQYVDTKQPEKS